MSQPPWDAFHPVAVTDEQLGAGESGEAREGGGAVGDEVVAAGVEKAVGSAALVVVWLGGHGAIATGTGESMIRAMSQPTAKM